MGGSAGCARSVAVPASVSMGGSAVGARSAAVAASASMGGGAIGARSAKQSVHDCIPRSPQRQPLWSLGPDLLSLRSVKNRSSWKG